MKRLATLLLLSFGCGQTTGDLVEVPFAGRGTEPASFVKDGWEVTLTEATLGFGSIFFCATESSSPSRCEVAILEFRDGVTLDGLDPAIQPIGDLFGTTGSINTAFFNYGIVWLLTEPQPRALAGTPGGPAAVPFESADYVPGGHSGRFRGSAICVDGAEVCCPTADACPSSYTFEAFVDVLPGVRGDPTINGARTSVEITEDPVSLTVTFDPNAWWQIVDYARLAALAVDSGEAVLGPSDPDYNAIVIAMSGNPLPAFRWESSPTSTNTNELEKEAP
ncbi:MAG: hypothetical protein WBG86_17375 [Polyangiales bacterium]